jgi:hypothetical protein
MFVPSDRVYLYIQSFNIFHVERDISLYGKIGAYHWLWNWQSIGEKKDACQF